MSDMLADRLAVGDVMVRYATSVDARDFERYASCFTDDVVVTGFSGGEMRGLADYMEWVRTALARYGSTQHLVGNQEVTIDGDRAHLRTYVQATHVLPAEEDTLLILWGVYDDHLVRTADGWKITRHHLERLIPPRRVSAR